MVSSVYWEWELLLQSIKLGIKLTFIYDGIRIFRILITHKNFVMSIEDLFFWIYATWIIFSFQLKESHGVFRGFFVLGMLFGMVFYNKVLGERLVLLAEKGIGLFKRQLTEIGKLIKIKLGKQENVCTKIRRKHGEKKNSCKKEKTKQSGNAVSYDGSIGDVGGSSRKQSQFGKETGKLSRKRTDVDRTVRGGKRKNRGNRRI